jgi:peptide/nickel transport system substrate-binding protein
MKRHRTALAGSLAALAVIVSACGSSLTATTTTAKPAVGGTLTVDNESGGLWTCGFNPFNGSVQFLIFGITYEPLYYDNLLTDKRTPMLATEYRWSGDGKTLTFTIRSGVQWSDGQPFSAADVVYTFNLLKQTR